MWYCMAGGGQDPFKDDHPCLNILYDPTTR